MEKLRKRDVEVLAVLAIVIIICLVLILNYDLSMPDEKFIDEKVAKYGSSPFILMGAQVIEAIFPYIPGQILVLISGYIYGPLWGTLLSVFSFSIGALIAYLIARHFGRPVVEKIISKKKIHSFDVFFHKHGVIIIFLLRTQFLFPNFVVSYASGLIKKLSWQKYLIATVLGFLPNMLIMASLGAQLHTGLSARTISLIGLIILSLTIYVFRHPIYDFIHREENFLKKEFSKTF